MENHPSLQYRRVWVKDDRQVQTPVYNQAVTNSVPSHVGTLRSLKPTPGHPCPAAPRALVFPRTTCLSPFGVHQEKKGEIVKGKMRARREKESCHLYEKEKKRKKKKKNKQKTKTQHLFAFKSRKCPCVPWTICFFPWRKSTEPGWTRAQHSRGHSVPRRPEMKLSWQESISKHSCFDVACFKLTGHL